MKTNITLCGNLFWSCTFKLCTHFLTLDFTPHALEDIIFHMLVTLPAKHSWLNIMQHKFTNKMLPADEHINFHNTSEEAYTCGKHFQ